MVTFITLMGKKTYMTTKKRTVALHIVLIYLWYDSGRNIYEFRISVIYYTWWI